MNLPRLDGKTCLVTGANCGIGLETARGLAALGARVFVTSRDEGRGREAVTDIVRTTANSAVELVRLDLASLASVRDCAAAVRAATQRLHVLVLNAGLIMTERRLTDDGFETTFGVNHLGHFLLTHELLPLLEASAPARVVVVASDAHRASPGLDFDDLSFERRPFRQFRVYGDSKLANILFARELARRTRGRGIVAHAVHPGVVRTRFAADGDTSGYFALGVKLLRPFFLSQADGAKTSLHVAVSEEAGRSSGLYWSRAKPRTPKRPALDDVAAKRLWEVSEALVGVTS